MTPEYPVYIVSKGRADSRFTSKALELYGVLYRIIVEPQEFDIYASVIDKRKILPLDPAYQRNYDTCDKLGDTKSKGPGAARNFAWDHAIASGAPWHWVMDDNIRYWFRLNQNLKVRVGDGTIFRCMEDFVLRYRNVGMAGPNYEMFVPKNQAMPPYITNTRIYSCNLIRNDLPFRWRGRYNEDTDLSLRMLKASWCTVQFNAFLQHKVRTQIIKGGNTDDFYSKEGTLPKSQMIVRLHPDCAKLAYKFGRAHHQINYRIFKTPLIRRSAPPSPIVNNYGMALKHVAPELAP